MGLTGTVWLTLIDNNSDENEVDLQWLEIPDGADSVLSPYLTDSGTTLIGDGDQALGATAIGSSYSTIQFPMALSTAFYVCEFCPP